MAHWIGESADLITLSGEGQLSPASTPDTRTPEERNRATIGAVFGIIGYFCVFISACLLVLDAAYAFSTCYMLHSWPHAHAEVERCQVYSTMPEGLPGPHSAIYGVHCNVTFRAGSHVYAAQPDLGIRNSFHSEMVALYNHLDSQDHLEIAYNPANPTQAHFAGDVSLAYAGPLTMLRVLLWLIAISIASILIFRRLKTPAS